MKERVTGAEGGGGGVGRRDNEGEKSPHYSIDMKSTLLIEVISSERRRGGGVINFYRVL